MTRSFAKLYLYINSENAWKAKLKMPHAESSGAPKVVRPAVKRKLNMGGAKNEVV
jgi:hypothetical protein